MLHKSHLLTFLFTVFIGSVFSQSPCELFPGVHLGNDTTLCDNSTLSFDLSNLPTGTKFLWDNGSVIAARTISSTGTYYVKASVLGDNLILNGNFEMGNVGFTTGYALGTGGTWGQLSNSGTYAVSTSPNLVHNNFSSCQDQFIPNGKMMIVNGANTPTKVWCQTVQIDPNTNYEFSTWITNALNDANVAQLQFSINNTPFGSVFSTGTTGCNWAQFFEVWNSGIQTSAQVCIENLNTSGGGNDFVIDDISFAPICVFTDTITVNYAQTPTFTLPTDYEACQGETITLDAENVGFDYLWDDGSTQQQLNVTNSGNYSVHVSDNGNCEATQTFDVTIHPLSHIQSDTTISFCNSDGIIDLNDLLSPTTSLNGAWTSAGDTLLLTTVDLTNQQGTLNYTYSLPDQMCSSLEMNFALLIKQYQSAGNDMFQHLCSENILDLNTLVTNNSQGNWTSVENLGNSVFNSGSGQLSLNGLSKGNYSFKYIVNNETPCPADTAEAIIEISEMPTIYFSADKNAGCSPLSVILSDSTIANGAKTYEWRIDGNIVSTTADFSKTFDEIGCHPVQLSVTVDGMCTATHTAVNFICVYPNPIADFIFNPSYITSDETAVNFENISTNNAVNQWTFGTIGNSSIPNPTFEFPVDVADEYPVTLAVESEHGCKDSITKYIAVRDQTIYYVPNAFTPDGDQFNNVFKPILSAGVDLTSYELLIYNRWGEVVFESHDTHFGWDGTYRGKLVPDGTYLWRIQFNELNTNEHIEKFGYVTLIR